MVVAMFAVESLMDACRYMVLLVAISSGASSFQERPVVKILHHAHRAV